MPEKIVLCDVVLDDFLYVINNSSFISFYFSSDSEFDNSLWKNSKHRMASKRRIAKEVFLCRRVTGC